MSAYCSACGAAVLPTAAFCHTCGVAIPEEERQTEHVTPHAHAAALARTGHLDEAISAYADIVAHEPGDAAAYVALATLKIAAHDVAQAENLLQDALALDPAHAVAWAYLGALLLERGAVAEAEDALAAALRHGPGEFLVRMKRGEAFLRLGRIYDALAELTHAALLDAPDKRTAAYARNLLHATRAQAARSAARTVGAPHPPRRFVRWLSPQQHEEIAV